MTSVIYLDLGDLLAKGDSDAVLSQVSNIALE